MEDNSAWRGHSLEEKRAYSLEEKRAKLIMLREALFENWKRYVLGATEPQVDEMISASIVDIIDKL